MTASLRAALLVFAGWTALAVFFAFSASLTYISLGQPPIWARALAYSLAQWWLWAALTPVVVFAARRWPVDRRRLARHLPVHLAFAVSVAFLKVWAEGAARRWIFGAEPYVLINNLMLQVLIYAGLIAGVHLLDRYGRSRAQAADAAARLHEARLELLQAQLQPHFLFNALNAVSELIHEDPERADLMIDRLGVLLRASMDGDPREDVTVDEELDLTRAYLAIQEARLDDRLAIDIDAAPRCAGLSLPRLLLQPLVENAIRHGIAPRPAGGRLWIRVECDERTLRVHVDDDGPGWPVRVQEGVGLTNVRARLAARYGDSGFLALSPRPGGGARVAVTVPAAGSDRGDTA